MKARSRFGLVLGVGVALSVATCLPENAWARKIPLIALLTAGQETPPINDSNGHGVAFLTLDTATRDLCYSITYTELVAAEVAAHFHAPGEPGVAADIVFDISPNPSPLGSPKTGCVGPLSGQQTGEVRAGLWYVNIHTTEHPGGEIRGQVLQAGGGSQGGGGPSRLPIIP